jgi:CheY-like chemotaxis protein
MQASRLRPDWTEVRAVRPQVLRIASGLDDFLRQEGQIRPFQPPSGLGTPIARVPGMSHAGHFPSSPGHVHRRVLVVDDDPRARAAVARLIELEGYEAGVAADGEEASGLLASWRPDLVVTDLNMPRLDGRGLLQRVKSLLPGTPVIVISARGSAGPSMLEGLEAADFFSKPVRVDALLARIRVLLGD